MTAWLQNKREVLRLLTLAGLTVLVACSEELVPRRVQVTGNITSAVVSIPAGDTVPLLATLWSKSDELHHPRRMDPGPDGFAWSLEASPTTAVTLTPDHRLIASHRGGGQLHVSARGITADEDFTVVWPLDSFELRAASRTPRVGDTVEIIHRAWFRTGEVTSQDGMLFVGDSAAPSPGVVGGDAGPGWSHISSVQNRITTDGSLDTVRAVFNQPGHVRLGWIAFNRWIEDTIDVLPASGPPHTYRRASVAYTPPPRGAQCFTLQFGTWRMGQGAWPANWPSPAVLYGWIPDAIALTGTPLIPTAPADGYRVDAAHPPALVVDRFWQLLAGDSAKVFLNSPKDGPRATTQTGVTIYVGFNRDHSEISGVATSTEATAPIQGRRISCG